METDDFATTVKRLDILMCDGTTSEHVADRVIQEIPVDIIVNNEIIVTTACAGIHLKELAIGFLRLEDIISTPDDLEAIDIDEVNRAIYSIVKKPEPLTYETSIYSSGARSRERSEDIPAVTSDIHVSTKRILELMETHLAATKLHNTTRGTHCSSLAHPERGILVSREDIGRHNTIDMIGGYCFLHGTDCTDKIMLTTGRVSAEIVFKIAKLGIPIILSHAVATSRAIEIAGHIGITVVGYIRNRKMRIYTNTKRVL